MKFPDEGQRLAERAERRLRADSERHLYPFLSDAQWDEYLDRASKTQQDRLDELVESDRHENRRKLAALPEEAVGQTVFIYPYGFYYPPTHSPPRRHTRRAHVRRVFDMTSADYYRHIKVKACKVKPSGS